MPSSVDACALLFLFFCLDLILLFYFFFFLQYVYILVSVSNVVRSPHEIEILDPTTTGNINEINPIDYNNNYRINNINNINNIINKNIAKNMNNNAIRSRKMVNKSQRSSSNVSNQTDSLRISPADMMTTPVNNNIITHVDTISPDISEHSDDDEEDDDDDGDDDTNNTSSSKSQNAENGSGDNDNSDNNDDDTEMKDRREFEQYRFKKKNKSKSKSKSKNKRERSDMSLFEAGYHEWEGKNTILCKGRIIGGPQKCKLIQTMILILLPSSIYIYTIAWEIYIKNEYGNKLYPLIVSLLTIFIGLICLIATAFMDPGIIPRTQEFESVEDPMCPTSIQPVLGSTGDMKRSPQPPFKQFINIGGRAVIIKYCCMLFFQHKK